MQGYHCLFFNQKSGRFYLFIIDIIWKSYERWIEDKSQGNKSGAKQEREEGRLRRDTNVQILNTACISFKKKCVEKTSLPEFTHLFGMLQLSNKNS